MGSVFNLLVEPFITYSFMRNALLACLVTSVMSGPLGVILVLRRLSLIGDALSHGILPGIALGYMFFGLSLTAMSIGGVLVGILIAVLAGFYAKRTHLNEDATLSGFYLFSLALGVLLLSTSQGNMKLAHLLFGNVLAITSQTLGMITTLSLITLIVFLFCYRTLMLSYFDPIFMQLAGVPVKAYNLIFLVLVVLNLVAACQSLGTLMALGIMMLPAVTANVLTRQLKYLFFFSSVIAFIASYVGLIVSYRLDFPTGPTIIVICGLFYISALLYHSMYSQKRC